MNTHPESQPALSRRETLRRVLIGGFALGAVNQPHTTTAATAPEPKGEPFVPENDYPFFGAEPPQGF